jgi:hypothetical protein
VGHAPYERHDLRVVVTKLERLEPLSRRCPSRHYCSHSCVASSYAVRKAALGSDAMRGHEIGHPVAVGVGTPLVIGFGWSRAQGSVHSRSRSHAIRGTGRTGCSARRRCRPQPRHSAVPVPVVIASSGRSVAAVRQIGRRGSSGRGSPGRLHLVVSCGCRIPRQRLVRCRWRFAYRSSGLVAPAISSPFSGVGPLKHRRSAMHLRPQESHHTAATWYSRMG